MHVQIDRSVNAAYVRFAPGSVQETRELDARRVVDYDGNGHIIGIEFLAIEQGVDLHDLPQAEQLAQLFRTYDVLVLQ